MNAPLDAPPPSVLLAASCSRRPVAREIYITTQERAPQTVNSTKRLSKRLTRAGH